LAIGIVVAAIAIFKAGLIAGALFAIASTFDVPVDKFSVTSFVLEQFCELKLLDNEEIQYNCSILVNWLIVISIIAFIVSIVVPIMIFGHWIVGLIIYAVGWILGYLLIINFVSTGG